MGRLSRIRCEGFKTIRDAIIEMRQINLLIGENGAGKSNFIALLQMLGFATTDGLQVYVGKQGGANSILYYGSRTTHQMNVELSFETQSGESTYFLRMSDAAPDTLIIVEERLTFRRTGYPRPQIIELGAAGSKESLLAQKSSQEKTAKAIYHLLRQCQVFQFHDTSSSALIRRTGAIDRNQFLYDNAGNLAAYLYRLRKMHSDYYLRVIETIRQVAPHFGDFVLEPTALDPNMIMLEWKERGQQYTFGPHQISDGLLRFIALATLLLQPEDSIPDVIIIDEPELGLHPSAVNILGDLIRKASNYSQIIIATQSANLVDLFEPEEIVVTERPLLNGRSEYETQFKRLNSDDLNDWLRDYSLGELWKKNVLGGKPAI